MTGSEGIYTVIWHRLSGNIFPSGQVSDTSPSTCSCSIERLWNPPDGYWDSIPWAGSERRWAVHIHGAASRHFKRAPGGSGPPTSQDFVWLKTVIMCSQQGIAWILYTAWSAARGSRLLCILQCLSNSAPYGLCGWPCVDWWFGKCPVNEEEVEYSFWDVTSWSPLLLSRNRSYSSSKWTPSLPGAVCWEVPSTVSVLLQPPMPYSSQSRYAAQKGIWSCSLPTWWYSVSKHHWFDHVPDAGYQDGPLICSGSCLLVFLCSQRRSSCSPPSHPQVHWSICAPATAPNEVFCFRSYSQGQLLNVNHNPAPSSKDPMGYRDCWLQR